MNQCIADSFIKSGSKYDASLDENTVLRDMLQDWNELGTHLYPSVTINALTYRGSLTPFYVFEAICSSYKDTPDVCHEVMKNEGY